MSTTRFLAALALLALVATTAHALPSVEWREGNQFQLRGCIASDPVVLEFPLPTQGAWVRIDESADEVFIVVDPPALKALRGLTLGRCFKLASGHITTWPEETDRPRLPRKGEAVFYVRKAEWKRGARR